MRFGQAGYRATSLAAVAADIGATKGAAYHHFTNKQALFSAVFAHVQRGLVAAVARRAIGTSAMERLRHGCIAYLERCTPPVVQIMLVDAPSVLGTAEWNTTEDRVWLSAVRTLIDQARGENMFGSVDTGLAARVISASITELAIVGFDPSGLAPDARQVVLLAVLEGLARTEASFATSASTAPARRSARANTTRHRS